MRIFLTFIAVLALAGPCGPRCVAAALDYSVSLGPVELEDEYGSVPAASDLDGFDGDWSGRAVARQTGDAAIRSALGSGTLPCPAFALASGMSAESPMIPYLSATNCDSPLATLRFSNGSAFPTSNFQACNSQDRFQILNPNGSWVTAPDTSLYENPPGNRPQPDMNFYATQYALRRRNCNRGNGAPTYYTESLQGRLLRLRVTCNNGLSNGFVYFAWSEPPTTGSSATDSERGIRSFTCTAGVISSFSGQQSTPTQGGATTTSPLAPNTVITTSSGTPVYIPCATIAVTDSARCGAEFGVRCPDQRCCSQWGWCQDDGNDSDPRWCGAGCQRGYGKCFANGPAVSTVCPGPTGTYQLTTTSSATPVYMACPSVPLGSGGRCGVQFGRRCIDGLCCSRWGYCQNDGGDSGEAWCGNRNCQLGYGKCFVGTAPVSTGFACPTVEPTQTYQLATVSSATPVYMACPNLDRTDDGRCGGLVGKRCGDRICCSSFGYCQDDGGDSGDGWCGAGCQLGYGKCFVGSEPVQTDFVCPTPTSTDPTPTEYALTYTSKSTPVYMPCPSHEPSTDARCGSEFGTRCANDNLCCSQYGYCQDDGGDSGVPWCGTGCQLGFGKCFVGSAPVSTQFACATETLSPTPAPTSDPIGDALRSGTLPCPALALGSGMSAESPMIPYLSATNCDSPLATLRFGNGSAFPTSNFQACNSQDRFQILNPNGTWVTAPDTSLYEDPPGNRPQPDMNFYATRFALQRRNCNRGNGAPLYYTESLQNRLLRLRVTCNNGLSNGFVYFSWSEPVSNSGGRSGVTRFSCSGGVVTGTS